MVNLQPRSDIDNLRKTWEINTLRRVRLYLKLTLRSKRASGGSDERRFTLFDRDRNHDHRHTD